MKIISQLSKILLRSYLKLSIKYYSTSELYNNTKQFFFIVLNCMKICHLYYFLALYCVEYKYNLYYDNLNQCSNRFCTYKIKLNIIISCCVQVQMDVSCWFVQDQLKGDLATELRIKFNKRLEDAIPAGED